MLVLMFHKHKLELNSLRFLFLSTCTGVFAPVNDGSLVILVIISRSIDKRYQQVSELAASRAIIALGVACFKKSAAVKKDTVNTGEWL